MAQWFNDALGLLTAFVGLGRALIQLVATPSQRTISLDFNHATLVYRPINVTPFLLDPLNLFFALSLWLFRSRSNTSPSLSMHLSNSHLRQVTEPLNNQ